MKKKNKNKRNFFEIVWGFIKKAFKALKMLTTYIHTYIHIYTHQYHSVDMHDYLESI